MPRPRKAVPEYHLHKQSGQAYASYHGRRIMLGPYGSEESRRAFARIASDVAAGRDPAADGCTVADLVVAFMEWAEEHYRREDGTLSSEISALRSALRPVVQLYADLDIEHFGPGELEAVQDAMIAEGRAARSINKNCSRIRKAWKWASSRRLVDPNVWMVLKTVEPVRPGRRGATNPPPVQPVPTGHIEAIEWFVAPQVWVIVELQRLTGARPGEILSMKPSEIDTSPETVWVYRPSDHKNAHRGHERTIYLGPRAREVLVPWLHGRNPDTFCFSPAEAEAARRKAAHADRKTPLSCGNRPGHRSQPRRGPAKHRDRYSTRTYRQAIARACDQAGIPRWHPHQLRHTVAAEIQSRYGLDAARAILGHTSVDVTRVYAGLDHQAARRIIGEIG